MSRDVIEPEDGGNGLSIANGAAEYHLDRGRQRNEFLVDDFVFFGMSLTGMQAGREIHGHSFGDESGAGVEIENALPTIGGIAGFLEQFALSRMEFTLAGIDATGGQFPEVVSGGVTILALEKDARGLTGIVDGKNDDRSAVMNQIAPHPNAAGFLDVIGANPEDGSAINGT